MARGSKSPKASSPISCDGKINIIEAKIDNKGLDVRKNASGAQWHIVDQGSLFSASSRNLPETPRYTPGLNKQLPKAVPRPHLLFSTTTIHRMTYLMPHYISYSSGHSDGNLSSLSFTSPSESPLSSPTSSSSSSSSSSLAWKLRHFDELLDALAELGDFFALSDADFTRSASKVSELVHRRPRHLQSANISSDNLLQVVRLFEVCYFIF